MGKEFLEKDKIVVDINIKGMGFDSSEKILISHKLKSGWHKIVKGYLPLRYFDGPGKLLVKHSWKSKAFTAIENTSDGTLYLKEPLILKEGMYFKRIY